MSEAIFFEAVEALQKVISITKAGSNDLPVGLFVSNHPAPGKLYI